MTPSGRPMDMTILVTGGAGYLGSQLVRDLPAAAPAPLRIRILDNLQRATFQALTRMPTSGSYEFHDADLMDPAALRRALEGVDTVVHLAALVSTPFSFEHPAWTQHVNHWGTARLVEECIGAGVRRLVYVSSASVYGPGGPFAEDAPCQPMGPYSQAKLAGEDAVLAARERLRVTVLRMGMVYGHAPAVRYDAVPNRFVFQAATGSPVTVFGDGRQIRPLVHVADAAAATALAVFDERAAGQRLNVVTDNVAVGAVAAAVQRLRPFVRVIATEQDVRTHLSLSMDGSRLTGLGWAPRIGLDEGLAEMLDELGPFAPHAPVHDPGMEE